MNSKVVAALAVGFWIGAGPLSFAVAAETKSQAEITARKGEFTARIINRTYEVARYATEAPPRQIRTLLIEQESDRTLVGDELDRQAGRVKITATPVQGARTLKPVFSFTLNGDEGHASGPYYLVTRYGCCAVGAAHSAFSLETGKLLFRYTGTRPDQRWLTLLLKGSEIEERILAFYLASSAADADELGADTSRVLSLTYARPSRALQRLFVRLPPSVTRDSAADWTLEPEWFARGDANGDSHRVLEAAGPAANAANGIGLSFRLGRSGDFLIPLRNDRLDPTTATVPPGFTLETASLP